MARTIYVVCANESVAERLAALIRDRALPILHLSEADVMDWWRSHPLAMQAQYHPYAVTLSLNGEIGTATRLAPQPSRSVAAGWKSDGIDGYTALDVTDEYRTFPNDANLHKWAENTHAPEGAWDPTRYVK